MKASYRQRCHDCAQDVASRELPSPPATYSQEQFHMQSLENPGVHSQSRLNDRSTLTLGLA